MAPSDAPGPLTGSWCKNSDGGIATKRFIRDNRSGLIQVIPYDDCLFWRFTRFNHPGLSGFAADLSERIHSPDVMLIHGHLRPGRAPSHPWTRRWARTDPSQNTLEAGERWLFVGDVDKVAIPENLDGPERWREAALWVKANRSPPALANAKWVICPSSSTGRQKGLTSFRYFAHLLKPLTLPAMKRWMLAAKRMGYAVDDCVAQIAQPVFIARPIFEGMTDPLAGSGDLVWTTDGDEFADVDWHEFDAEIQRYESEVRQTLDTADGDWLARLELTLGGPESFLVPLKRACRTAVALGVGESAWTSAVSPLVDAAVTQFDAETAAEKRGLYCDAELRRMHRIFSKYAQQSAADVSIGLASLGLTRR